MDLIQMESGLFVFECRNFESISKLIVVDSINNFKVTKVYNETKNLLENGKLQILV